jgi:hypothetical protein
MIRVHGRSLAFFIVPYVALPAMTGTCVAEHPNILLIVSEGNGPELGCYGEPYVKTPVLDRLAEDGVRFENAFVPQAGCSQSRAALLTGLYPHQNGQIGLATWKFRMYREDTPSWSRRHHGLHGTNPAIPIRRVAGMGNKASRRPRVVRPCVRSA